MKPTVLYLAASFGLAATALPAAASPFVFNNGFVDGRMASASRPAAAGFEIESADDFLLADRTFINTASFTGLLPIGLALSSVADVRVEIYRVFPNDSTAPPSGHAPTRANSPSDAEFSDRDSASSTLTFSVSVLNPNFSTTNSVTPGKINPFPNQTTGGNGPVRGQEVSFDVSFATPFDLLPDHYFFVPQVGLSTPGDFLWLSSVRPIVAPGTPFAPDLQAWTRDASLEPDWLRIGTDIVGGGATAPTFNLAFTLSGITAAAAVPEPQSWTLLAVGLALLGSAKRRQGGRNTDRARDSGSPRRRSASLLGQSPGH